jgi:hypothetical protein
MIKLTIAVLAVVLAGTASAGGWRDLRIDASSEASFAQSVELLRDKLTKSRRHAFERALQDIWTQRTEDAIAEELEYTQEDYFAQLDGLSYEQVVRVLDPTGERAQRYRAEYYYSQAAPRPGGVVNTGNGVALSPPGYGQTSVL